MHRTIVIGSVCYDHIWLLNDSLISGGRVRYSDRRLQLGGGAYHTGRQLLDLGAEVAIVSQLRDDEMGRDVRDSLLDTGFDTTLLTIVPGETWLQDIFLEPNGERTILVSDQTVPPSLDAHLEVVADGVYINAIRLSGDLVANFDRIPLVVSQLPLRKATPRPADYVITSLSDVAGDVSAAWEQARSICGSRLKTVVVTDGPRPITLFDGYSAEQVQLPSPVQANSTVGAGDRFAGAFIFAMLGGGSPASAALEASRITAEWLNAGSRAEL